MVINIKLIIIIKSELLGIYIDIIALNVNNPPINVINNPIIRPLRSISVIFLRKAIFPTSIVTPEYPIIMYPKIRVHKFRNNTRQIRETPIGMFKKQKKKGFLIFLNVLDHNNPPIIIPRLKNKIKIRSRPFSNGKLKKISV